MYPKAFCYCAKCNAHVQSTYFLAKLIFIEAVGVILKP